VVGEPDASHAAFAELSDEADGFRHLQAFDRFHQSHFPQTLQHMPPQQTGRVPEHALVLHVPHPFQAHIELHDRNCVPPQLQSRLSLVPLAQTPEPVQPVMLLIQPPQAQLDEQVRVWACMPQLPQATLRFSCVPAAQTP
jgi:hypothetical protein